MKVVIDIPENDYWLACNYPDALIACYAHYIKNGIPLPEKHGRLIDESVVLEMIRKSMGIKDLSFLYNAEKSVVNEIYHAPTVIEAEGEE